VSARVVELTQIHHGNLAEFLTPFRHVQMAIPGMSHDAAMRVMNFSITRQAGMIAYINGFLLLAILSVVMLPLVFFLRIPRAGGDAPVSAAMAD
jgi:DHA2 family multidrug resistance protein